ncbi:uncharacterized protein BO80DRAFT_479695 [Aspergillus ibericus CBS 121593]|uniref:Uncharacterized protein n=1 Tax=Aspergillus ibericus CBS 121593 TaxID=1448316 RepID=A0A395GUZ4_9EURO|nr:hypothetical protein BO80DRAFT_479695 [Aspergillus ibericus CBS 121593]RAK98497.1 hypothetical protein BO80DRAFT_479695 [Aspergillus ibericus CBS 121593]
MFRFSCKGASRGWGRILPPVLDRLLDLAAQPDQWFASDTLLADRRWRIVKDRFRRLSMARERHTYSHC